MVKEHSGESWVQKPSFKVTLHRRSGRAKSRIWGAMMVIGNRLKELRESKELSQGDIEKRTGLLRCYISRVENGHTVPAVSTLEKMARALEVPMYRLFHDGEVPAGLSKMKPPKDDEFGSKGTEADYFSKLRRLLAKMEPGDQKLLLHMAQKVARD
jgi:transcriptional regulator with XRE-family HTH domain